MIKNCYQIKGNYYFRKQVLNLDYRKSLKKLCGKKLYNKLLLESLIFNLTNYLNDGLEVLLEKEKIVSMEEIDTFVKELLKKYKQEVFIDETGDNSFIDNINSKKSVIEDKRFKSIEFYDDNGNFVAGHTQKALDKEIALLQSDFDSNNFGKIANAAKRILQRQEVISDQEIEKVPEHLRRPFFEALIKVELGILNQDIKNFQYNTGITPKNIELDKDLLSFIRKLRDSGQLPEVSLDFKEDDWDTMISDYINGKKSENLKLKSIEDIQRDLEQFQLILIGDLNFGIKPRNIRDITKSDLIFIKEQYKKIPNMTDKKIVDIKDRGIYYLIHFSENCNSNPKKENVKMLNISGINSKFKNIRYFIKDLKISNPIYKDINFDLWEKLSIPRSHLSAEEKVNVEKNKVVPLESDFLESYLVDKYPNTSQGTKNFKVHTKSSAHIFWSKMFALYSGARSEEIAQLKISDFHRVELNDKVIFYFHIMVTDIEKQSLKTSSSKRIVPLHNNLIRLGFLNYLKERKKLKGEYLFDLNINKYGKRQHFAKNVNDTLKKYFKEKYPEIEQRNPTFHSLRSHFISKYLKQRGDSDISLINIKKIVGHEDSMIRKDITVKHYFKEDLDLDHAYDIVNGIDFHIDKAQVFYESLIKEYTYKKIIEDLNI